MPARKEEPVEQEQESKEAKIEILQKKIEQLVAERERLKSGEST